MTKLSESVGPSPRGIESCGVRSREEARRHVRGGEGARGGRGSQGGGAPLPLTLVQRSVGVGRPFTEQFVARLLPRGNASSSPLLSSRGSRSGGGTDCHLPQTLAHSLRGAPGLSWVQTRMHKRQRRRPSLPPRSPRRHELSSLPSGPNLKPKPGSLPPKSVPASATLPQS